MLAAGKAASSPSSPCSAAAKVVSQKKGSGDSRLCAAPGGSGRTVALCSARRPRKAAGDGQTDASGGGSELRMGKPTTNRQTPRKPGQELADLSPALKKEAGAPTRSKAQSNQGAQERSTMRSIGLDLGAKKLSFCEVKDSKVIGRATVRNLEDLTPRLGPNAPRARVVFEASRDAWYVHAKLTEWGHEPVMVDTTRVKMLGIGHHRRKNDRIDAEVLAHAAEHGRIPRAHVLSPERQQLRKYLGVRRSLVEARANFATTIRGILRAERIKFAGCAVEYLPEKLRKTAMPENTRELLNPIVKAMQTLNPEINRIENQLYALCEREPVVALLGTMPGVGLIVAAAFVSVIDNAQRFRNAHQVEAYLGLVPRLDDSGDRKRRLGSITKKGNSYLRAMLIQTAWQVLKNPNGNDPLKRWADAIVERRGKRVAVVAVARRIVGILWAMWRDGTVYDPCWLGKAQAQGLKTQANDTLKRAEAMRKAAKKLQPRRIRPSTSEAIGI